MSLDELLALLPDNSTGAIGADDLRTIVTELWNRVTDVSRAPYTYKSSGTPTSGQIAVDAWGTGNTIVHLSETALDGTASAWGGFEQGSRLILRRSDGNGELHGILTGDPVDNGVWRDVPVNFSSATGAVPNNNSTVTVMSILETTL